MKKVLLVPLLLACLPLAAGDLHGKVVCKGVPNCDGAVVYVGVIAGETFPVPKEHAKIDQKDQMFLPRVLAVQTGSTVDFLNSDVVLHSVFTRDACAEKFDLGVWSRGEIRSYTFKQECVATILCNVHHEMIAFVIAVPTPYFAMVKGDGSYRVHDVPDGAYTVKIWHEKLKAAQKAVTVAGLTEAALEITK